jgi:hypothetical protein
LTLFCWASGTWWIPTDFSLLGNVSRCRWLRRFIYFPFTVDPIVQHVVIFTKLLSKILLIGMYLLHYLRTKNWNALLGYALFIGMMATGYYYNLTFVQLGLVDLGTRIVGLSERLVVMDMAYLALITCLVALSVGWWMKKSARSSDFLFKLRLAFAVVLAQTLLTFLVAEVRSETTFLTWIVAASIALGVGVPVTFSMTVDLIPVRDRGLAAALITAAAYFAAAVFSTQWQIQAFRSQILGFMAFGALGIGALAFFPIPLVRSLAYQHARPEFGRGRYVRYDEHGRPRTSRKLVTLIALMFGIYFIDSLGFLRLVDTPVYMNTAWQSPDISVRMAIGVTHVLAAFIAGVLYTGVGERGLFLWIFGIFALVHQMYGFGDPPLPGQPVPLASPLLYAVAVSLYTVVNFALWADLSTPRTISRNSALGVALSGWTATFFSTALAIRWRIGGMTIGRHLSLVDALAILFFLLMLVLTLFPEGLLSGRAPDRSKRTGRPIEDGIDES